MKDSQIIKWIQDNLTAIRQETDETYTITYLSSNCISREKGKNLRDAVRKAANKEKKSSLPYE